MVAHARIVNLYKSMQLGGRIGIVHALQTVYPYSDSAVDHHAAELQDALENRLYLRWHISWTNITKKLWRS